MTLIEKEDLKVSYVENFLKAEVAHNLFEELKGLTFVNPTFKIAGRKCISSQQIYCFSDDDVSYAFAGYVPESHAWTENLLMLKKLIEEETGYLYNLALINY